MRSLSYLHEKHIGELMISLVADWMDRNWSSAIYYSLVCLPEDGKKKTNQPEVKKKKLLFIHASRKSPRSTNAFAQSDLGLCFKLSEHFDIH